MHVGLPDRRPRPVRLGPGHGRGAPPPGGLRIPAGLRTRTEEAGMSLNTQSTSRQLVSRLRIFAEDHPDEPLLSTTDRARMTRELGAIGVTLGQWEAAQPVAPGASQGEVFAAYRTDIDRLVAERGFRSVDVASIGPDNPKREEMRAKFLDEHFHKEDEVRFFVAGSGLFTLHVDGKVYEVRSEERRVGQGVSAGRVEY